MENQVLNPDMATSTEVEAESIIHLSCEASDDISSSLNESSLSPQATISYLKEHIPVNSETSKRKSQDSINLEEYATADQDAMDMENETEVENTDDNTKSPQGWSLTDKENLLKALKYDGFSADDLSSLSDMLKKSPEDIKKAIEYYQLRALKSLKYTAKSLVKTQAKKRKVESSIPLIMWLNYLTEKFSMNDLQTETADALRLIAECESFPEPARFDNIDLRAIYLFVADAMEGRVPSKLNYESVKVLKKCLYEVALLCNSSKHSDHVEFIKLLQTKLNMGCSNRDDQSMTYDEELQVLRTLCAQTAYNPFNIPETLLKSYGKKYDEYGCQ